MERYSYTHPYYCIDKDYDAYLKVCRERKNLISENADSNMYLNKENNYGLKLLTGISESIEWEYDNDGYDIDPDFNIHLKSIKEKVNESSKPIKYDLVESNKEGPSQLGLNGPGQDLFFDASKNDRNEICEAIEHDLVESKREGPINNQNKFSLGSNGQCLDLILYATENDRNETFEAIEYDQLESNMEDPINNNDKNSLGSNGQCLDLILYATENDKNETFEVIEYDQVESNMEDPINNMDKFSLGSNGQCEDSFLDATKKSMNDLSFVIEKSKTITREEDNGEYRNDLSFVMEKSKRIKDEEEDGECSSDIEILTMSDALDYGEGNLSSFVSSKVYLAPLESEGGNWQCSTDDKARSKFREEVMAVYQKPYDRGELDELLEEIQLQKPVTGWKNLRGRSVSFPTDRSNKSYLDHYPDLKTELDRIFLDPPKMLNTLRGFFYWLENLSREGAFKPWLDPLCKDVNITKTKQHSI